MNKKCFDGCGVSHIDNRRDSYIDMEPVGRFSAMSSGRMEPPPYKTEQSEGIGFRKNRFFDSTSFSLGGA